MSASAPSAMLIDKQLAVNGTAATSISVDEEGEPLLLLARDKQLTSGSRGADAQAPAQR